GAPSGAPAPHARWHSTPTLPLRQRALRARERAIVPAGQRTARTDRRRGPRQRGQRERGDERDPFRLHVGLHWPRPARGLHLFYARRARSVTAASGEQVSPSTGGVRDT